MKIYLFIVALAAMTLSISQTVNAAQYRHPSGVAFNYPDDWQLRDLQESLLLVPPTLKGKSTVSIDSSLPERFIWVGAEAVAPETPIDHPEIGTYFDSAVISIYPQARRSSASTRGDVGVMEFAAGQDRMINVLYRLENGLALFMAHSYKPAGEAPEDSVFTDAFESFHSNLKQDANLVGSWYRSESSMTDVTYDSNVNGASYASASSQHRYTFLPNNRFEYASSAQVYGQSESVSGGGSVSSGGDNPIDGGTYAADGNALSLAWDEGDTVECTYNTFLKNDGTPALKMQCGETAKFYTYSE